MRTLQDLGFPSVLCAAGTRNMSGEGWFYTPFFNAVGWRSDSLGLVTKTVTSHMRVGNMPTDFSTLMPKKAFPDCVKVDFVRGSVVNSVGLTNPGITSMLCSTRWEHVDEPLIISYMPLESEREKRDEEIGLFVNMINLYKDDFARRRHPVAIQVNLSCPNTGHEVSSLINDAWKDIELIAQTGLHVIAKFNALAPVRALAELENHDHCFGICTSNTIPFGDSSLDWMEVWGTDTSPLPKKYKGGGYSGDAMVDLVEKQVRGLRTMGFTKHLDVGGGIRTTHHIDRYVNAGADSIFMGSVIMTRPWRLLKLIAHAERRLEERRSL